MSKPQAWVELVDPQTGRKVDVLVSFHSDWEQAGEPRGTTEAHVRAITHEVIRRLTGEGSELEAFGLSDYEGPGR